MKLTIQPVDNDEGFYCEIKLWNKEKRQLIEKSYYKKTVLELNNFINKVFKNNQ